MLLMGTLRLREAIEPGSHEGKQQSTLELESAYLGAQALPPDHPA